MIGKNLEVTRKVIKLKLIDIGIQILKKYEG